MTKRRNRSILTDSNAVYYYLAREGVKAAHVARVNGISRSSMTNKMTRDLDKMTIKSFLQIAKGVGKPVGVVIEEVQELIAGSLWTGRHRKTLRGAP